jgi:PAS domain S-box-containing protein
MTRPDEKPRTNQGREDNLRHHPAFPRITIIPGAVALLLGILGLAGMYFGIAAFRSLYPGYQTMAFSTALLLILFGGILIAGALLPFGKRTGTVIQGTMILGALIGVIELPLNISGNHFFVESGLVAIGNLIAGQSTSPISPATIVFAILTAIGFFLLMAPFPMTGNSRIRDPAGISGLVVALGGLTFVLSYLYGSPLLYSTSLIPVAAPTALAFLAVGSGLVTAAGSRAAPLRYISGDSIRAHLLRTFLPLTIAVILIGTALDIARHNFGATFDAILTSTSIVAFCLIMGAVVIRVSGGVSDSLEAARREQKKAEDDLRIKNSELESAYQKLTATEEELRKNYGELAISQETLKKSESRLRLSSAYNRSLIEASLDPLVTISPDGTISDVNSATINVTGFSRGELIGTDFSRYFTEPDRAKAGYETVFREGTVQDYPLGIRHVDGGVTPVLYNASVYRDEQGGVIGVFAAARDITGQKSAEEALRKANDELEDRVKQRTAELEVKNEELTAAEEELHQNIDELSRREQDLSRALAEKEVLLAEIHHRVKNNLTAFISLLSLDGSTEDTPAGKQLKMDLQNRARSMALVHETLYRTHLYNEVDMEMYLKTLIEQIARSFQSTMAVKILVNADDVLLDIPRATPAGLIVNELVTNSFKYAFPASPDSPALQNTPPAICVSLSKNNGTYEMIVRDNGVGLPPEFELATARSLGLKLVNFLARHQLRAEVSISQEHGTEFTFRFGDTSL